jgi:hypothetical protein
MKIEDTDVLDAMEKFGAKFVRSLAQTMRLASSNDFVTLKQTFNEIWAMDRSVATPKK